ncbi:MAG: hypothetical protein ACR2MN_04710 [Acidimicrobiales bacterium]
MVPDVFAHRCDSRPGWLAPLLEERGELWSRWDRADRLAARLERRAGAVASGPSPTTAPHPRLTAAGDPIDELVAIDAAVVADVLALQAAQARLRANARAQAGSSERLRVLARSAAALVAVAVTVLLVGVVQ